jgi:hypothetical protein
MISGPLNLRSVPPSLIATLLVGIACMANAESDWYSCHDAQGRRLSGQWPPDGCVGEICKTNSATGARTCTPPPETPEQQKRREDAEKRQRECEKKAHDQHLDDLRFLDRYWSNDIIEDERNRALAEQQGRISDARKRLEELRTVQKKLDSEAEFYGTKHPIPPQLRRDVESNRKLLDAQKRASVSPEDGMRQVNERYDEMRKRRRDLLEKGSVPSRCDNGPPH